MSLVCGCRYRFFHWETSRPLYRKGGVLRERMYSQPAGIRRDAVPPVLRIRRDRRCRTRAATVIESNDESGQSRDIPVEKLLILMR